VPYGLTRLQDETKTDWEAGIDARYSITPQMAIYGTLNPDFATVEADVEQVNLTRFEVSLPEPRQFFLEGNELFAQRIRTFYSRVADIRAALAAGPAGTVTAAFITAQTEPDDTQEPTSAWAGYADMFGRSSIAVNLTTVTLTAGTRVP
jgi:hypothetical protein